MTVTMTSYPRFDGTRACATEPTLAAAFTAPGAGEYDIRAAAVWCPLPVPRALPLLRPHPRRAGDLGRPDR